MAAARCGMLGMLFGCGAVAQTPAGLQRLPAVTTFSLPVSFPRIVHEINPAMPFTIAGPRGALLGQQDGSFEAWLYPWKIFSNLRITAEMKDYPVPIDVNEQAATIDVQPDHTTITYSHANFTVRETLFAPSQAGAASQVAVAFEVEAVRPMELTFSLTPQMKLFWPAASDDSTSPEWVATAGGSGFYILHENLPDHAAALAMPGAETGIMAPYQERPKTYPLQFVERFDPAKTPRAVYPLLMTVGETTAAATREALHTELMRQDAAFAEDLAGNARAYQQFLQQTTSIETPDARLNESFRWAELAIRQLRVQTYPSHEHTALVAGFFGSGDSARPGFGWFFGRDALYTLYAVNSYGDAVLSRQEVEFLLAHQRADGKIMHERSQAANLMDWESLPYQYASADSTPLLLMEMADFLNITGDRAFVQAHWEQLAKAWAFETTHDSDGDGIYDNSNGTGWVESWPPGMPHQEIYMAAVDQQASTAYARLATAMGHADVAQAASARARKIAAVLEKEYYEPAERSYVFSHNADGSVDASATIFPAVAWWDGTFRLQHAGELMDRWASNEFSTDWGTRDLSPKSPFYDPISYHQGTVWPLYTGWASVAEYRAGRPLAGYDHLKQNSNLTWSQDLGAVTELLSGEFFHPLGRSTSHQLWSSAMVVTPVMRGMFGFGWDAEHHALSVAPQLPASWNEATVKHVPMGTGFTDVSFRREGRQMVVTTTDGVTLRSDVAGAKASGSRVSVPLPPVEVFLDSELPQPGATTQQAKAIGQEIGAHSVVVHLEVMAGTSFPLQVRVNGAGLRVALDGKPLGTEPLQRVMVSAPRGQGYVRQDVRLSW